MEPANQTPLEEISVHANLEELVTGINDCLSRIKTHDSDSVAHYLTLGRTLTLLKSSWPDNSAKDYYKFCTESFQLKKSTVCGILQFGRFMDDYPKFRKTGINYTQFKNSMSNLTSWFATQECGGYPITDFRSKHFWK